MAAAGKRGLLIAALTLAVAACAPPRIVLPQGPGTPVADFAADYASARKGCESLRSIQATLGLSGRAGSQRMRGRVLTGVLPDAARLEGVAPFGSPAFIFVADGERGVLLLPRDRRVVRDAPAADILDALAGIALGPADLLAVLGGCAKADAKAISARAYGSDWLVVDVAPAGTLYLQRAGGVFRIAAARYDGLEIDYLARGPAGPTGIALRSGRIDLRLSVSDVEVNAPLPREQLVALSIPEGTNPLTVEELRRGGPLGEP